MLFHRKFGSNLFESSKLISTSDLHPSTERALLILWRGTHHVRMPSFSRKVADGRTTSANWVVEFINKSTATIKSSFLSASFHFFGSRPIPPIGLHVCIHIPLMGK